MFKGVFITEEDLIPLGQKVRAYHPELGAEEEEMVSEEYEKVVETALGENWMRDDGKGLSWDEFQKREDLREVVELIGSIYVPTGYQVSKIAPPPNQSWKDVKNAIQEKKRVYLRLWIEKLTPPPSPLRKERYIESEIPTAFGLLAIDPETGTVEYIRVTQVEKKAPEVKEPGGSGIVTVYTFPHGERRGGILSERELEELGEKIGVVNVAAAYNELETLQKELVALRKRQQELKFLLEELEKLKEEGIDEEIYKEEKKRLRQQLRDVEKEIKETEKHIAALQEKIREAEGEKEAREEEETWQEYVETLMERQPLRVKLLKEVLLERAAGFISHIVSQKKLQKASESLWKAKKKDSDKRDDVEGARRKLEEGLKALSEGDGLEALEDFAIARFYLFDHDSYTEPLVNAFDDLMDMAWSAYKGRKYSKERAREVAQRILKLIENPRGNRAEPPRRVDSPRDARLWETAKRIVKDEYKDVEEDTEQFWRVVSRIFTRMKLRLGGAREEAVEKIVEELREKHGKLPGAGKGARTAKGVGRLREKHLRSKGG